MAVKTVLEGQDVLENLKDAVEVQVKSDEKSLNDVLVANKIIIAVVKGPEVLAKLVKVVQARKRTSKIPSVSSETLKRIKEQKKLLKDNADAVYVFTLIEKTKDNIDKLNLKDMTSEAIAMFNSEIQSLISSLAATQKLLTHSAK